MPIRFPKRIYKDTQECRGDNNRNKGFLMFVPQMKKSKYYKLKEICDCGKTRIGE